MEKLKGTFKSSLSLLIMISFIVAIVVPLHPTIIDIAVVVSLALAITIYMRASTIEEWFDLKSFPTLLLLTAIFRIALNVTTTRKILTDGYAGEVIESAGNLIVGASIWIGFVIFIILMVVQFVVANGFSRSAEVNARFTLDGLPMKQMTIDSELNNGLINPDEAKDRRTKLDMEVDYYGNMDGAAKFVKGDVIISIVLFFVNIIFGFIIGMLVHGMSAAEAIERYTILTIGDGLVNQLSSLLVAVAAGVVMTRVYSGEKKNVAQSIFGELTVNPLVLYVVGSLFLLLGVFTEMPLMPFAIIAALLFYLAYAQGKRAKEEEEQKVLVEQSRVAEEQVSKEEIEVGGETEPISIEVGIALIPLAQSPKNGGESITDKVKIMRQVIKKELGVRVPSIHVEDNSYLKPTGYRIKIKDSIVAEDTLRTNAVLALKTPYVVKDIQGEPTKDPVFGEDAVWIKETAAEEATANGYMVYDPLSILSTHLDDVIRKNLHMLLQRQEVHNLIEGLKDRHKVLTEEIDKKDISLATIQGVLQNFLRESLSIRDLPTIIEGLVDADQMVDGYFKANEHNKVDEITTIVREKVSSSICEKNKNKDGKLYAILFDPETEAKLGVATRFDGYHIRINMTDENNLMQGLIRQIQRAQMAEINPILLVSNPMVRTALARMLHKYKMPISVISQNELVQGIPIEQLGVVSIEE